MHTYMCNCYLIFDCDDSNKIIKSRYHDIHVTCVPVLSRLSELRFDAAINIEQEDVPWFVGYKGKLRLIG
jgi:DNA polymerase III delta prime subunit